MSDTNIIAIKLLRIGKKNTASRFNTELIQVQGHPALVSQLWPLENQTETEEYMIMQSFGKMYVGENFSVCLRISNASPTILLYNVTCTCFLQYSGTKNYPVLFQQEIVNLKPQHSELFGFSLNVTKPDVYYLSIQAQYRIKEMLDPAICKRLFKFDAKFPLETKNQVFRADSGFMVQSRVTNNMNSSIFLKQVEFIPGPQLNTLPLYPDMQDTEFQINSVRNYLYQLVEVTNLPNQIELGRLSIIWQNTSGDIGSISTEKLTHTVRYDRILQVTIENKQRQYEIEAPVAIQVRLHNQSGNFYLEDVRVVLNDRKMNAVILTANGSLQIGKMGPKQSSVVDLVLFPRIPGIQTLEGLQVYTGSKAWDFPPCEIFIT